MINTVVGFNITNNDPVDNKFIQATTESRDAIPSYQRYEGLTVYVVDEQKSYRLQGGLRDNDWGPFPSEPNKVVYKTVTANVLSASYYYGWYTSDLVFEKQWDFLDTITTTGNIEGWSFLSGSITALTASIPNHPGIVIRRTGTTANGFNLFYPSQTSNLAPIIYHSNFGEFSSIMKVVTVNVSPTSSMQRFGLFSNMLTPRAPAFGIYFEKSGSDTQWQCVFRSASVEYRVNTGVDYFNDNITWYNLKCEVKGEEFKWYINNLLVAKTPNSQSCQTSYTFGHQCTPHNGSATDVAIDLMRIRGECIR